MTPLTFPLMWPENTEQREKYEAANLPREVPWAFVASHEAQCLKNHSQTAQRLAERGGLTACEMLAVIEDRRWRLLPGCERQLRERLDQWEESHS